MEENKNKFKSTIILRQVTPMIHFQANDYGACLRATDVKPKLDKFILKRIEGFEKQYKRYKVEKDKNPKAKPPLINADWFIDPDKSSAFDYRMTISIGDTPKAYRSNDINSNIKRIHKPEISFPDYFSKDFIELPKAYFGNMTSEKNDEKKYLDYVTVYKEAILFESEITLSIFSSKKYLLEAVLKNIEDFFMLNNFGTRSDKGLGSFYVSRIDGVDKKPSLLRIAELIKKDIYHINLNSNDSMTNTSIYIAKVFNEKTKKYSYKKNCLDIINGLYSNMKSGHSIPKPVTGFLLNEYYRKDFYKNDRDFVKDIIFSHRGRDINSYKYVRVYLGLCDHMDFLKGHYAGKSVKITPVDEAHKSIDEIQRIPSPILFKVLPNEIVIIPSYALSKEEHEKIKGILFEFREGTNKPEYINAPSEFELKNFLNEFEKDKIRNNVRLNGVTYRMEKVGNTLAQKGGTV